MIQMNARTTTSMSINNNVFAESRSAPASGFLLTAVSNARHIARLTSNFVVKARLRYSTNVIRSQRLIYIRKSVVSQGTENVLRFDECRLSYFARRRRLRRILLGER